MAIWIDLKNYLPVDTDRKSKDLRNRMYQFIEWAIAKGLTLEQASLAAYRLFLIHKGYSPSSVKAHISSVRGWINGLIKNGQLQHYWLKRLDENLSQEEKDKYVSNMIGQVLQSLVTESESRKGLEPGIRNLNLEDEAVNEFIGAQRLNSLRDKRDAAVNVTLLATGIRKEELINLEVQDFNHFLDEKPAVRIAADGRLVPFLDDALWALDIVRDYLNAAGITKGPVFKGIFKSGNMLRSGKLSASAVERILATYPIHHRDELITLKPLDLRHAYASHTFRSGRMNFEQLKRYLGVKTNETVVEYLGRAINPDLMPYTPYTFDLSKLGK